MFGVVQLYPIAIAKSCLVQADSFFEIALITLLRLLVTIVGRMYNFIKPRN